jgi:hypothetical protein
VVERGKRARPKARLKKDSGSRKSAKAKTADDPALEGIELLLEITEALKAERGDREKLWGSMIKQTLKRRRPGFNESSYGFRSFSDLLEEAQARDLIDLEMDEKSGGYIVKAIRNG